MQGRNDKAELIKWWDALDTITGQGSMKQDIAKGLQMARECQHEDARWLASLFPGGAQATKNVLLAQGDDPRAMLLASFVGDGEMEVLLLRRAAKMGYAPAQAIVARRAGFQNEKRFVWAEKAAAQGDRTGLFQLGTCFSAGRGCDQDRRRAMMLVKEAAELGHSEALYSYGRDAFEDGDWERYRWWGRAAARGCEGACFGLIVGAIDQLKLFDKGRGSGLTLFEIGAACKGHLDGAAECAFGSAMNATGLCMLMRTVAFHDEGCDKAKRAVVCWILIGRRLGVVKDIRMKVARMVWLERCVWSNASQC
jgi:hypothetical protein